MGVNKLFIETRKVTLGPGHIAGHLQLVVRSSQFRHNLLEAVEGQPLCIHIQLVHLQRIILGGANNAAKSPYKLK